MAPKIDTRKTVVLGRLIRSIVAGLALTLLLGGPVAAGTTDSRYFERAHQASAWKSGCRASPDSDLQTCRILSISVFAGKRGGTDPATRLTGYEVNLSKTKETTNHATGEIVEGRYVHGSVINDDALQVRFDGVRGASVQGTMYLSITRCDDSGECVESGRRMAIDLDWTAPPGPASKSFSYYRYNDAGCESIYTATRRGRNSRLSGGVDGEPLRARGHVVHVDLLMTRVCT